MSQALSSQRSWIARIAVLAMVASLMAFGAAPAGAAIDTSASCPDSIADAGFTDLAGVPAGAVDAINCVADYGISTGKTATTFAPFENVQRWEMALFLTRQAAVHGVTLPSGADQGFTDLAGVPAAAVTAINQTAQLGISTGTTTTTFDPFADVQRWEMALFLTRLITGAGLTLPAGADQGFTDLGGVPATAVTAINQLGELDIADGTTTTTYEPFSTVERWAMALFLTRVLAADGITPAPPAGSLSGTVSATGANNVDIDDATGKTTNVTYGETSDTYSVDGAPASKAVFDANVGVGDTIVVTKVDADADYDTFALTNVTVNSGVVGAVDISTDSFSIVTLGNNILKTYGLAAPNDYNAANTSYTVDGASATFTAFEAALSHGDTVVVTPDPTTGGDGFVDAIALTNGSPSGTVAGSNNAATADADGAANDGIFMLGNLGDSFDDSVYDSDTMFAALSGSSATQSYSVDGSSATLAQFLTALTDGDMVTYSRAAGQETFVLVNQTPDNSFSGIIIDTDGDRVDAGNVVETLVDGAASSFDLDDAKTIKVDGVTVTVAEVEALVDAGIPIGDSISYDNTTLTITSNSSTPVVGIDNLVASNDNNLGNDSMDLLAGSVQVFDALPANFATPNAKYFVNGTEVTQSVYEDYLVDILAGENADGTAEVGDSFQAVVNGSFVEHRLTTDNSLTD